MSSYPWIILQQVPDRDIVFELPGKGKIKVVLDIEHETKIIPGSFKGDPKIKIERETIRDVKVMFQKE